MQELNREAFELVVGSIPAGILVIRKEGGKVIYANEYAIQLCGVDPRGLEMPDYSINLMKLLTLNGQIYPSEQLPSSIALLTGEKAQTELIIERHDGSRITVMDSAKPIRDQKGEIVAAVVVFEDITERKKIEETLRENQKKYQDLIETNYDFIWEIDPSGRYTYCSPQIEKLWGLKPAEMIGRTPFDMMPPSDKETALKQFMEASISLKPLNGIQTAAYDSQSRLVFVETNWVPFFDSQGGLLGFRGISRDISERKKLEKQLHEKERLAAIGATAGMVGHDLRNPLQTIISELYLAKAELTAMSDGQRKAAMQESLDSIAEQVSYMDKVISDLQTFVKPVEAHKQIVNLEPFIVMLLAQISIPENIQASTQVDDALTVSTDPQLLKRVLINLVTNAVQAMPNGGELAIKAQTDAEGQVQITVEDTGDGIADDVKPKLFTPLFTTKPKGQGFGLSVCKRVLEAQGASISFESQVGKGTKFIITMPKTNK